MGASVLEGNLLRLLLKGTQRENRQFGGSLSKRHSSRTTSCRNKIVAEIVVPIAVPRSTKFEPRQNACLFLLTLAAWGSK